MPEFDLPFILLLCFFSVIIPMIVLAILTFWLIRKSRQELLGIISPDMQRLAANSEKLKRTSANITDEQVLQRLINQQAIRSGVIGGITGLGGVVTLPIALPADILLTSRIQAALVEYIAQHYGQTSVSESGRALSTLVLASGGTQVGASTARYSVNLSTRFLGKSLSKLIPFIGMFTGFAVNYAITQLIGRTAVRMYRAPQLA